MNIVKLNATDSTNNYMKGLCSKEELSDFTIVMTNFQTNGRGQMGTIWSSDSSKNLMCSVFKDVSNLSVDHNFFISIATALGVAKALREFNLPKIKIKWPNDILSENLKVSGILIENNLKQAEIKSAILGIGINVNQKFFEKLPQATSIHLMTGKVFSIDEVLFEVLTALRFYFSQLERGEFGSLKAEYESQLFRLHKPSTFLLKGGDYITGYINGISSTGKLEVLMEDAIIKTFDFKELKLLY